MLIDREQDKALDIYILKLDEFQLWEKDCYHFDMCFADHYEVP